MKSKAMLPGTFTVWQPRQGAMVGRSDSGKIKQHRWRRQLGWNGPFTMPHTWQIGHVSIQTADPNIKSHTNLAYEAEQQLRAPRPALRITTCQSGESQPTSYTFVQPITLPVIPIRGNTVS